MTQNPAEEDNTMKKPLRVGLIGVTGYAYAYFLELQKLIDKGLVEWGAVTIINPAEAEEQVQFFKSHNVPVYDDYREMLEKEADRLDWMCIPTAISWHKQMTIESLDKGIPVLLEKPMAPTLQEVKAIQEAEKRSGKPVAIGFQYNYGRGTAEIKKRLLEGAIGDIKHIDCICLWPRDSVYYHRNNWAGCVHDGHGWVLDSPLHNALSHLVNLILFFAGKTMEGRADLLDISAELYRAKCIQNYDTVRCETNLDSGVKATVFLSHSSLSSIAPEIRVTGTKGEFVWRFGGTNTFETPKGMEYLEVESPLEVRDCMFNNVARLLHGDSSVHICSTEQAKGEVKWVNAVQDAVKIHDIPSKYQRELLGEETEIIDTIENLEYFALRAYRERKSFKELGVPWAVDPGYLDLSNYHGFKATHVAECASAKI
jgi:predicted dehydrogenase